MIDVYWLTDGQLARLGGFSPRGMASLGLMINKR
jgi:hypothetical protein